MSKLPLTLLLAIVLVLAVSSASASASVEATGNSCPSFRVLHDDRIGAAVFPAGDYTLSVRAGLGCKDVAQIFARLLEDYDGVLPGGWKVTAEGSGKASFTNGKLSFSVSRNSGGGGGNPLLGSLCKGTYTVNAGNQVGPIFFPRGGYLLYIPRGSGITCRRATILFTRFLGAPGTELPSPWRVLVQTATFYKPANSQRSAFRVEPLNGAGPR